MIQIENYSKAYLNIFHTVEIKENEDHYGSKFLRTDASQYLPKKNTIWFYFLLCFLQVSNHTIFAYIADRFFAHNNEAIESSSNSNNGQHTGTSSGNGGGSSHSSHPPGTPQAPSSSKPHTPSQQQTWCRQDTTEWSEVTFELAENMLQAVIFLRSWFFFFFVIRSDLIFSSF